MVQNVFAKYSLFSCLLFVLLASCASKSLVSQKLPLKSHAHIGHSLSAWHGTPDEQGLFVVAENEVQFAINEVNKAIESEDSRTIADKHVANALYALDPTMQKRSKDRKYGAIKALNESTDHMLYAAQADDASENLVQMVETFNELQVHVVNKLLLAVEIIQLTKQASNLEHPLLLSQLQSTLYAVIDGDDVNQNGKVELEDEEVGLLQLRQIISSGLRNEVPQYHPVGKKYLLGLVRLSNGNWAYKFDASNNRKRLSYGY